MNMLSTPIAKSKKGTTSAEIILKGMSKNNVIPIAITKEAITTAIPESPRRNQLCTNEGK